ncbi:MAG: hypothetical protein ABGZ35_26150, partial [Planctomycetaceae bacterium]
DNNGAVDATDVNVASGLQINAVPFSGDFLPGRPGDEIGLFDGVTWYLDSDGDNNITSSDVSFSGNMRGRALTGDFDGDGLTDLAGFVASLDTFYFDLAADGLDGVVDDTLEFGFDGVLDRPVAGDYNLDGIADLGVVVPHRDGVTVDYSEWYLLISDASAANTGTVDAIDHPYSPQPVGGDLFAEFGTNIAWPLFANFDPPVSDPIVNRAPTVSAIADLELTGGTDKIDVNVVAIDPDGDFVTYDIIVQSSAQYWTGELGLYDNGNNAENWGGRGEKWLKGDAGWYFITPDGALHAWDSSPTASGDLIAMLDPSVHMDFSELNHDPKMSVSAAVNGTTLELERDSGWGHVMVTVVASDGTDSGQGAFEVSSIGGQRAGVEFDHDLGLYSTGNYYENWGGRGEKWLKGDAGWYFITPDGSLFAWNNSTGATGTLVARLNSRFHTDVNLLVEAAAIRLDEQLNLSSTGNDHYNWGGRGEKWLRGDAGWYFITADGSLFEWDSSSEATGTLIQSGLDQVYYQDTEKLYDALDDVFTEWSQLNI